MNQLNYFVTLFCISKERYTIQSFKNYLANYASLNVKCLRFNPAHSTVEEQGQSIQIAKEYLLEKKDYNTLVEVCIPHYNAKPRINLPPKELCIEYKKGDLIKLYKTFNENQFSGDLKHLNISVGKKLTWGDWIGLFEVIEDNEEYVGLKFNRDLKMVHNKKPVVLLDSDTNRDYSLSHKDIELIDISIKNNVDIISCSFSTNREVIENYFYEIENSVKKYNVKRPLIILKLEEKNFVSNDNLNYLRSIKSKFNGLSISRGDLYCSDGIKAPIYEERLLKFAKEENIPIRIFTMIGENYNEGFTRNDLFCIYSYIKSGIDMIGFSDESIYLKPVELQNMINDIEKIAYEYRIELIDKGNVSEKEFNDIKFLIPQRFNGVLKDVNIYINSFFTVKEYLMYCLFKGTVYLNEL